MTNRTPEAAPSDSDDGADCAGQPVLEISEARRGTIGGALEVRRALPGKPRRMVGAWCFLDHAGPLDYAPGEGLAVGPHPHIGLQTFTWMIEGEIEHLDSLGYRQMLRPGQVNLMTAGRGISHAEVSPTDRAGRVHTAQLWIALPDQARHIEPSFEHHPQLPQVQCDGFTCTVLVGEALGEVAPPRVILADGRHRHPLRGGRAHVVAAGAFIRTCADVPGRRGRCRWPAHRARTVALPRDAARGARYRQ